MLGPSSHAVHLHLGRRCGLGSGHEAVLRRCSLAALVFCVLLPATQGSAKRDYYEVLDIPRDADDKAIKQAYRKGALKNHPDKNPDDREGAETRFREVAEAYEVLSDPEKRKKYDRFGHDGGGMGGFGGRDGGGGFGFSGFHFKDPMDIFKDMFGDEDPFADFSKFFDNINIEESFGGGGGAPSDQAVAELEEALSNFYRAAGLGDKAEPSKVKELLRMPKWVGKEKKLADELGKKYPGHDKPFRALRDAAGRVEKSRQSSEGGGGFGFEFPDLGNFGFGDLGGFGGRGGGFNVKMGGNMGGFGSMSSFSFSSSSSGGKTVKSETKIQNGKRVTKTIESDGKTTKASMEAEEGGRIKRQSGVRRTDGSDRVEM